MECTIDENDKSVKSVTEASHYTTKAEDRISLENKFIYSSGIIVNNLLGTAIGAMMIVFNLGLGMDPFKAGLLAALPRLFDAFTDPLIGFISDNHRSKWGRRRPFMFIGAILTGLFFMLLWKLPVDKGLDYVWWYFLIGSVIFYAAYTVFATPLVALGYEMTPDYHERTRLMGFTSVAGNLVYFATPWFFAFMKNDRWFDSMADAAASLGLIIGSITIVLGLIPAIFLKERQVKLEVKETSEGMLQVMGGFFKGFGATLKFKPFLKLCIATFLIFNSFMLINSFQTYIATYYLFEGDMKRGGYYMGIVGMITTAATYAIIIFATYLSTKVGKRKAFFICMGLSALGYVLRWFCYSKTMPWLMFIPAPLVAFGMGSLFTLINSMVADVCDLDELQSHERREGMFGSIFWWVIKLGLAAALALSGYLLNLSGFDIELGNSQSSQALFLLRVFDVGIPLLATVLAIWAVASYKITEEKAHEIRESLEKRRGQS
ncbi:MFS transporter [Lentisphaera marina]|uniref:MFS transporter n=1 Tax=Lentisphaera marina TaxID=1111041 RepID=UPI0023673C73|nr:MFS transporter [Lentisphaera marina]MDD7986002.1 MFS transporter [Lentisphaera marina]